MVRILHRASTNEYYVYFTKFELFFYFSAGKMNKYQNGKIYVIKNRKNDLLYVGSTTRTLEERGAEHFTITSGARRLCRAILQIGAENFYIELLEEYPCNSQAELEAREYEYIEKLDTVRNGYNLKGRGICIPYKTPTRRMERRIQLNQDAKYQCERCHYSTDKKTNIVTHFKRKQTCSPVHSNISCEELLKKLYPEKDYKCQDCGKTFSHYNSLWRHKNTFHVVENVDDTTVETETETETETEESNEESSVPSPIPYGKENMTWEQEEYIDLLFNSYKESHDEGLPHLIRILWCNQLKPEYMNVYLKREHRPKKVAVYESDENGESAWKIKDATFFVEKLIERVLSAFTDNQEQLDMLFMKNVGDKKALCSLHQHIENLKIKKRGYGKYRDMVIDELRNNRPIITSKYGKIL
jgi:group I intron endonuclease